ncbi:Myb-like_DNA-binding domain-containing protein [Hexamita inflata]|uniref:Myb-like DNA-binding domain-containing protein n=1 Tax=Hexamita inflata TaxID=28002 RepID=A0AA86N8G8_9EUKA|nr:Myb-like DNA-binding domain-containing protein [Hexamita inflata]
MNKREYQKWTEKEKEKLINIVSQNMSSAGRIYWDEVCPHFTNRTALQCKNYYQNILRPQLPDGPIVNRIKPSKSNPVEQQKPQQIHLIQNDWSQSEQVRLSCLIIFYGSDISKLKVFFQNRTQYEIEKQLEIQQQAISYFNIIFHQMIDGQFYQVQQPQEQLGMLVGTVRMLSYRAQFINLQENEETPKVPDNLSKLLHEFIGPQLDVLLTHHPMDFIEQSLFDSINKEFGLRNVLNQLPKINDYYKKLYGDGLTYE